jgi:hypothetical protein
VVAPHPFDSRISESYRVQHASGELRRTRRGVAGAGFQGNSLGHHATKAIEIQDSIEFSPEAGRSSGKEERILKPAAEQLSGKVRHAG